MDTLQTVHLPLRGGDPLPRRAEADGPLPLRADGLHLPLKGGGLLPPSAEGGVGLKR